MSLKTLDTKLSLQGALSGASDVSDASTVKKFSAGGFAASSQGTMIVPASQTPGAKNSVLHGSPTMVGAPSVSQQADVTGEPQVNNVYAINSSLPEPLAIYSFSPAEIPALSAAAYQAYFEDKCSLEFSKNLIKLAKKIDEKSLKSLLDRVVEETKIAEGNLELVERYLQSCFALDGDTNNVQAQLVKTFSAEKYANLTPDKLGLNSIVSADPFSLLSYAGASKETLSQKSNTAIMTQLLYLASKQMTNGASSRLLGETIYASGMSVEGPQNVNYVENSARNDTTLNLRLLSLSDNINQSFVYPDIEDVSYLKKLKVGLLPSAAPAVQKAAYLVTMLANEMATSTGLARLEGTQLGQSFTSTGDYRKSFWGADLEQSSDATSEATTPNSLTDFFVVNAQGQSRVTSETGILLFDGTKFASTKNRKNAFDAFVFGSIRSPLSKTENRVQQFSNAQQAAISRFDLGIEFFKTLQCRNTGARLLTPRGLFTRLISEFSDSLSLLKSENTARGRAVIELCLLSHLGKEISVSDDASPASVIKRSLLSVMVKKALQIQYQIESANPKVTAVESQKSKPASSSTRVTTTDSTGNTSTVTVTAESVGNDKNAAKGTASAAFAYNPNPKNPRLCLDEQTLFDKKMDAGVNNSVILAFGDLPLSNAPIRGDNYQTIDFTVKSLYDSFFSNQDGFIDKLVKIYVDVCDESLKLCDVVGQSPVNAARLTKNSLLDGTLLLALLLEAACLLSAEFIDSALVHDGSNTNLQKLKKSKKIDAGTIGDVQVLLLGAANIRIKVNVGENTQTSLASSVLGTLAKASQGDDFNTAFIVKNGNLIMPGAGALPVNTPISFNELGHTTVSSIFDTFYDLVFERELPALCLASVAGMVQYFDAVSLKYRDIASQLLGLTKQTDDVKQLINLAQSSVGGKFFASLNDFTLDTAKRKLNILKKETQSASGRVAKLTLGELRCIQLVLKNLESSSSTNNFVVAALPKDFVTKSLNKSYAISADRNNASRDETMLVTVEKRPIFEDKTESAKIVTMIRSPLDSESFSVFDTREPANFSDVLANVTVDGKELGSAFIQKKLDVEASTRILTNEIVSYLLKKLFSVLSSADLFADNILDFDVFPVDNSSASTAKLFAKAYGMSPSIFDSVFSKLQNGTTYINEDNLTMLSTSDFDFDSEGVNVKLPPLKFGEAELFYDLFETVYFQPGAVFNRIFTVSILDETVGFVINASNFSEQGGGTQKVTMNGLINNTSEQKSLTALTKITQVPTFDTYSLSVTPSEPLDNK